MARRCRDKAAGLFQIYTHSVWAAELFRHLLRVYRYVLRNPVEAGMSTAAEGWRWSSFAAAVGDTEPIEFVDPAMVISCFDGPREIAAVRLRAFVAEP